MGDKEKLKWVGSFQPYLSVVKCLECGEIQIQLLAEPRSPLGHLRATTSSQLNLPTTDRVVMYIKY